MAGNPEKPGRTITEADLAVMLNLTKVLALTVARGDLDRALELLKERRRTLQGVVWPQEANSDFWEKVEVLRRLEEEVLTFCHTWRQVVEKRLKVLNVGHFLRMSYCPPQENSRFVDVSK